MEINGGQMSPELLAGESRYRKMLWFVVHKDFIKKLGIFIVLFIECALILFAVWVALDTYLLSSKSEDALVSSMGINQELRHNNALSVSARPLMVGARVGIFSSSAERFDFYTTVENPNANWRADFTYQFVTQKGETEARRGFILPSEKKPVAFLAYESVAAPQIATLRLSDIKWSRINRHAIPDFEKWKKEKFDFEIIDASFVPRSESQDFARSSFTVKNKSGFGYWAVDFYILLYRGSTVESITKTSASNFAPGDIKSISTNWFGAIPSVTRVEIVPEINLFDESVYMPLFGETTTDLRERIKGL